MNILICRLAWFSLLLLVVSGCAPIYINDDGYRAYGRYDQRFGRYPPFEAAQFPPPCDVFAYEVKASHFKQATGRYQWIIPHGNVCVVYPQSLDQWAPFMDSVRQTGKVEMRLVVWNYFSHLIRDYQSWLRNRGWDEPIFVMSNSQYGNKFAKKGKRFLVELAGPGVDLRPAPVLHLLLDPEGRLVYTAREDEDPKTQGAKPRATIEAEIRQLLAQP